MSAIQSLVVFAFACVCLSQGQGMAGLFGGNLGLGFNSRRHLPYPPEIGEDPGKYRPLPIGPFAPRNTTNPLAPFFRHPQLLRLLMGLEMEPMTAAAASAGGPAARRKAIMSSLMRAMAQ